MATALLDRIETERISQRAREVRFSDTLLRLVATFFFLIGWTAAKVLGGLWLAVAFCGVAVAEGWREGRPRRGG
jgi:hypothetical protein